MSPRRAATWFRQLSSLTRAGITLPASVREATGPSAEAREALAIRLEAGTPPREAWLATPFLAKADALVLAAGQLSGRFPDVCDELFLRHEASATLRAKMLTASLYPLFLLNGAIFLFPFIAAPDFSGRTQRDFSQTLSHGFVSGVLGLIVFWGVVLGIRAVALKQPDLKAAALRFLPGWGGVAKQAAYAVFAGTLASLLRAGIGIGEAWKLAGDASGDPAIARLSGTVAARVENDRSPPGTVLATTSVFPESFRSLYRAGEVSGSLEARLDELRARHADEAGTRATIVAFAYTKALLVLAMLLIAVRVLSFWSGYFQGLRDIVK